MVFGFVPFCLEHFYGFYLSSAVCVLPVIVTSAHLFRLRPEIDTLDRVRAARAPNEVADEVPWLWYYHAPNGELLDHNMTEIEAYKKGNRYAKRKIVASQLIALWSSPHWIAVVNIAALPVAVDAIHRQFSSLPKDFSGKQLIAQIWKDREISRIRGPRAR